MLTFVGGEAPEVMTPTEAGVYARCSTRAIYEACRRGDLGHARMGRQIRIRRGDLDRWIGFEERELVDLPPDVIRMFNRGFRKESA